jgi:putative ABC transport system substrate-binding protein
MAIGIGRRQFVSTLGGAAVVWPLAAGAQQTGRMRVVGALMSQAEDDPEAQSCFAGFRQGLEKRGWSEGRNVRIVARFAAGKADPIPALAKELVGLQPDVILAQTPPVTAALQHETHTIPIVFVGVSDPVGPGFVASVARPGGNITGLMTFEPGITGKWLAILKEIAPRLERVALIANPKNNQLRVLPASGHGRGSIARYRTRANSN